MRTADTRILDLWYARCECDYVRVTSCSWIGVANDGAAAESRARLARIEQPEVLAIVPQPSSRLSRRPSMSM